MTRHSPTWAELSNTAKNRLIGEEILGLCWHEFTDDRDYQLQLAREDFEKEYGETPPEAWTPWDWEYSNAVRCIKCDRRWDPSPNTLGPRESAGFENYSTDMGAAWKVVKKLWEDEGWTCNVYFGQHGAGATFEKGDPHHPRSQEFHSGMNAIEFDHFMNDRLENPADAICLAAVRLKGLPF